MTDGGFWFTLTMVGIAGLGTGVGMVLAVFALRMLRRYMRDEGRAERLPPKRDDRDAD